MRLRPWQLNGDEYTDDRDPDRYSYSRARPQQAQLYLQIECKTILIGVVGREDGIKQTLGVSQAESGSRNQFEISKTIGR